MTFQQGEIQYNVLLLTNPIHTLFIGFQVTEIAPSIFRILGVLWNCVKQSEPSRGLELTSKVLNLIYTHSEGVEVQL